MKRKLCMVMILLLVIFLTACGRDNNKNITRATELDVYYIDNNGNKIVSETYTPVSTNKEQLVSELLGVLTTEPKSMFYKKAIPDSIAIKEYYFTEDDILSINFDSSYHDMNSLTEVLCRATIVLTLSQIRGVDLIEFFVNGQNLKDANDRFIGLMTARDFLSKTGTETNYQVSLYFSNPEGTALIATNTNIYYTGTGSMEEIIIKQLINGPIERGMLDTIPDGTTLLNVKTRDGVCYVDFNERFMDKMTNISDQVTIFSVVNSLVELPSINKVQFLINGEIRRTFREGTPFDVVFERNLAIVEGSN